MTRTCRQALTETHAMFYSTNTFNIIFFDEQRPVKFCQLLRLLGADSVGRIKRLVFSPGYGLGEAARITFYGIGDMANGIGDPSGNGRPLHMKEFWTMAGQVLRVYEEMGLSSIECDSALKLGLTVRVEPR